MVGSRGNSVKALVVLAIALAGCFWRSYGRLAATHAELLVSMARKGVDLVAAERLTAESMPELTYPLERAQAFVATARARTSGDPPPSLVALAALVDRYRTYVDALDRGRRTWHGDEARAALRAPLADVEQAGAAVADALRAEGRASFVIPEAAG